MGTLVGVLLLLLASGSNTLTIAAMLLIALSLGPAFPTVLGMATSLFQQSASRARAASAVMVMGSTGGFIMPWFLGILLVQIGPRFYLLFLLLCVLLMLGIYTATRFLHDETS